MGGQEKIFIISPVRNIDNATYEAIAGHVARLEADDYKVHWPGRGDTNQDDQIGLRICTDNREAIYKATRVDIWLDHTSAGSKFDLGMLYYFLHDTHKEFTVINEKALGWPTPPMSLGDVFWELGISASEEGRDALYRSNAAVVLVDATVPTALFRMGMAFASLRNHNKKIIIANRGQISPTPHKSFQNVFLELTKAS